MLSSVLQFPEYPTVHVMFKASLCSREEVMVSTVWIPVGRGTLHATPEGICPYQGQVVVLQSTDGILGVS